MTTEERLADLERRMLQVERLTTPLIPLGPRKDYEQLDKECTETARRIADSLRERIGEVSNG